MLTISRYLINDYSGPFIHEPTAHHNIAQTCVSYLSFTCFDDTLDDGQIIDCIYNGDYCLDYYAETNWIEHVKNTSGCSDDDLNELIELLKPSLNSGGIRDTSFSLPQNQRRKNSPSCGRGTLVYLKF